MSDAHQAYQLELAEEQLDRGQVDTAIHSLTRLLGEDPEHAGAHALLALALLRNKRLYAAQTEARRALELEPELLMAQLAAAMIAIAQRRFRDAERQLHDARALYPDAPAVDDALARLYSAWGRDAEALDHNRRACELAPDDVHFLSLRSRLEFDRGNRDIAAQLARNALQLDPESVEALSVLGHCALAAGRPDDARAHAAWALQVDPTDSNALALLGSIKARQSWVLGVWWRFQSFLSAGSRTRTVLSLLGMYLAYRAALLALDDNGHPDWQMPLSALWLGFCVYTWVAPGLFWRSVRRELQQVRLRPGF
ncbi:tetratricopeptide repeat protein [Montanilutibacter psychrotolerans]|nr:tetratricopeptide repeat protein [Lysobacter psychrotolerans]